MRSIAWTSPVRVQAIPQPIVDGSSQGTALNWPSIARGEGVSSAQRAPTTPVVWPGICGLACKLSRAALSSDAVAPRRLHVTPNTKYENTERNLETSGRGTRRSSAQYLETSGRGTWCSSAQYLDTAGRETRRSSTQYLERLAEGHGVLPLSIWRGWQRDTAFFRSVSGDGWQRDTAFFRSVSGYGWQRDMAFICSVSGEAGRGTPHSSAQYLERLAEGHGVLPLSIWIRLAEGHGVHLLSIWRRLAAFFRSVSGDGWQRDTAFFRSVSGYGWQRDMAFICSVYGDVWRRSSAQYLERLAEGHGILLLSIWRWLAEGHGVLLLSIWRGWQRDMMFFCSVSGEAGRGTWRSSAQYLDWLGSISY
ncbi:UNVERIFIED_CONTAM: hypothetical protein FKN15_016446 [Acipenser sinensis]